MVNPLRFALSWGKGRLERQHEKIPFFFFLLLQLECVKSHVVGASFWISPSIILEPGWQLHKAMHLRAVSCHQVGSSWAELWQGGERRLWEVTWWEMKWTQREGPVEKWLSYIQASNVLIKKSYSALGKNVGGRRVWMRGREVQAILAPTGVSELLFVQPVN